ncbi:MAG TPA: tripartite tricarboxylate transporter substrate binding protein [Myxococcaceae bacterium]|nr:tripartite tricarboxylate transporter substrate binding protein [Myxococcaceae bacterium]
MRHLVTACGVLLVYFLSATAGAETPNSWPARPLRLIVGAPAGSTVDFLGRLAATRLADRLGQSVVVENRPGAGGNVGAQVAAKAPADGYTLLIITAAHAISPSLYSNLGYDLLKDFDPVSLLSMTSFVLVVNPELPVRSVKELIQLAGSKPGELAFASAGNGSPPHLAGELFTGMAKVKMVHVPYKGDAPAVNDLLSGRVPVMFLNIVLAMPHVRGEKLRPLATTGARRAAVLPDVPTVAESGLEGFEVNGWWGIMVPHGTPQPIIARLSGELGKIMQLPELRERLTSEGSEPVGSTPQRFEAFIRAEIQKWAPVVKASGAHVD